MWKLEERKYVKISTFKGNSRRTMLMYNEISLDGSVNYKTDSNKEMLNNF
jgi:hypothetical protein